MTRKPLTPADMARRRWEGVPAEERSELMRAARAKSSASGRPRIPKRCPKCGEMQESTVAAREHCRG